eukprot:2035811-Rhodomonas_salina.4
MPGQLQLQHHRGSSNACILATGGMHIGDRRRKLSGCSRSAGAQQAVGVGRGDANGGRLEARRSGACWRRKRAEQVPPTAPSTAPSPPSRMIDPLEPFRERWSKSTRKTRTDSLQVRASAGELLHAPVVLSCGG